MRGVSPHGSCCGSTLHLVPASDFVLSLLPFLCLSGFGSGSGLASAPARRWTASVLPLCLHKPFLPCMFASCGMPDPVCFPAPLPAPHKCRWTEEKTLRVWTPPGYSREAAPPGGWPVLWLCDGSNKFEDHLAHQARHNRAGDR